jgi:hypothetical protein
MLAGACPAQIVRSHLWSIYPPEPRTEEEEVLEQRLEAGEADRKVSTTLGNRQRHHCCTPQDVTFLRHQAMSRELSHGLDQRTQCSVRLLQGGLLRHSCPSCILGTAAKPPLSSCVGCVM